MPDNITDIIKFDITKNCQSFQNLKTTFSSPHLLFHCIWSQWRS